MLMEIGGNKGVNMKFLFGDKVKVVGGFYQEVYGVITDYSGVENKYYVEGYKRWNERIQLITAWINESELVKAEE